MHGREYSIIISTFRRNLQGFVYVSDDSTFVQDKLTVALRYFIIISLWDETAVKGHS